MPHVPICCSWCDHEGVGEVRIGEEKRYSECLSSSGQVSFPTPSLQLSSMSDESLVLLFLSHSDEVELMATFTPADVISVLRLGSRRVGYLLGAPIVHQHMQTHIKTRINSLHQLISSFVLYQLCLSCQVKPLQGSVRNSWTFWDICFFCFLVN